MNVQRLEEIAMECIALADKHSSASQSAAICVNDARKQVAIAKESADGVSFQYAARRATQSLRHSVGIFHADCRTAMVLVQEASMIVMLNKD